MRYWGINLLAAVIISFGTVSIAASSKMISYQGRLTDATSVPVADGNYSLTFRIWTASSGGSLLWSESQNVAVAQSFFDVLLGSVVPIDDDVLAVGGGTPDPGQRYLEITVGSEVITPRTQLVAAPYASVARRLKGDICSDEGQLFIRDFGHLEDSAAVNITADSSGSSLRMVGGGTPDPSNLPKAELVASMGQSSLLMIGGGTPDPSDAPKAELKVDTNQSFLTMIGGGNPDPGQLVSIDLTADSNQASFLMIGGGNPEPSDFPNFGLTVGAQQSSITMIGGGNPDPSNSPLVELTTHGLLQRSSLTMIGGGNSDPGEVSLDLRSAYNDSARINIHTSATSMGIELRNSSDQVTAQLSGSGLGLFVDAGSSGTAPIGTRFRDNAVVAWGKVQAGGSLVSNFGVLNVTHPSSGQYTIMLSNSANSLDNLIPTAIAEVSGIPVTATAARLVTVNQLTPNSFAVYITNGGYTPVDNDFVFLVTAR